MTNAYDPVEDLRKVTSLQKKWRDAFSTGALDSRKWTSSIAAGVTTGADTAIKAALASNRNYLTGMQLQNVGTAATEFQVKDGTTVIWRVSLPASMGSPISIDFPTPLRATTNTALNVQAVTASSAVVVNAQGYQAP